MTVVEKPEPKFKDGDIVKIVSDSAAIIGSSKDKVARGIGDAGTIETFMCFRVEHNRSFFNVATPPAEYKYRYKLKDCDVWYDEDWLEMLCERPLRKEKKLFFGIYRHGQGITEKFDDVERALKRASELEAKSRLKYLVVADYQEVWV